MSEIAVARVKSASSDDWTSSRIITATLGTLKEDEIVGTDAQAIARTSDINQALIFHHFGSVDDLVIIGVWERGT